MSHIVVSGSIEFDSLFSYPQPAVSPTPTSFSSLTPPRTLTHVDYTATGSGFTYDAAGFVTGGTINALHLTRQIAVSQSGPLVFQTVGTVDVTFAMAAAGGILLAPSPLLERVLAGDDQIDIGDASGRFTGDVASAPDSAITGGDDTFSGNNVLAAEVEAYGDAILAYGTETATVTGGADRMSIGAGTVEMAGDIKEGNRDLIGGDDWIARPGSNAAAAAGAESLVAGDAISVSGGTTTGGDDVVLGADGGAAGEILVGDVAKMFRGTLIGGDDEIYGRGGDDQIFGDAFTAGDGPVGGPTITGGDDQLYGGDGNDFVIGDVGFPDPAILDAGDDTLYGGAGDDNLLGDQQNLHGLFAADVRVKGGDDLLLGGTGNDNHVGGGGNDTIDGGSGTDSVGYNQLTYDADGNPIGGGIVVTLGEGREKGTVTGSHGNDVLISIENVLGSLGDDLITANSVANTLNGSFGNDRIHGLGGNDVISGEDGDDTLYGEDGNDVLNGGAGRNILWGGEGKDRLVDDSVASGGKMGGGGGNDTMIGGSAGSRSMSGGSGNDTFRIGGGTTTITTGSGRDTIAVRPSHALDEDATARVRDFDVGHDRIDLRALGITGGNADARVDISRTSSGALISVGDAGREQTILLLGVDADSLDLHSSDFLLAS